MSQYLRAPLEHIEFTDNQRSTFDRTKLNELADTIKEHGVIVPILVRPHPKPNGVLYQGVAGERRWRASKLAGVTDIPLIVEDLTDKQVAERQLIENSQREGLHELDEAQAYQELLDDHGYTMDDLVAKTGKSHAHLYGRLKLLKLTTWSRKQFKDGHTTASIAELAARAATPKMQEDFLKDCMGADELGSDGGGLGFEGIQHETIRDSAEPDGLGFFKHQPLSYRAAKALFYRKYVLRLEVAKFPVADPQLIEGAGACGDCEHKSGNQPGLPGLDEVPRDLCTNPPCFEKKTKAAWDKAAADAEARGIEVDTEVDPRRIFQVDGQKVTSGSPYIDLDTDVPANMVKPGTRATFGKLLGKRAAEVKHILIKDDAGAPREMLVKSDALRILREAGKLDTPEKPKKPTTTSAAQKAKAEKDQARRELGEAALERVLGEIAAHAAEDLGKKEVAVWRWIAREVFSLVGYGDADLVSQRRGLKSFDAIEEVIENVKSAGELRGIIVELLMCTHGTLLNAGYGATKETKERWESGLKLFDADFDKAITAAREAAKAEAKSDKAKDKKKGGGR